MNQPEKELIRYRLNQAQEMLDAAEALAAAEVSAKSVINHLS